MRTVAQPPVELERSNISIIKPGDVQSRPSIVSSHQFATAIQKQQDSSVPIDWRYLALFLSRGIVFLVCSVMPAALVLWFSFRLIGERSSTSNNSARGQPILYDKSPQLTDLAIVAVLMWIFEICCFSVMSVAQNRKQVHSKNHSTAQALLLNLLQDTKRLAQRLLLPAGIMLYILFGLQILSNATPTALIGTTLMVGTSFWTVHLYFEGLDQKLLVILKSRYRNFKKKKERSNHPQATAKVAAVESTLRGPPVPLSANTDTSGTLADKKSSTEQNMPQTGVHILAFVLMLFVSFVASIAWSSFQVLSAGMFKASTSDILPLQIIVRWFLIPVQGLAVRSFMTKMFIAQPPMGNGRKRRRSSMSKNNTTPVTDDAAGLLRRREALAPLALFLQISLILGSRLLQLSSGPFVVSVVGLMISKFLETFLRWSKGQIVSQKLHSAASASDIPMPIQIVRKSSLVANTSGQGQIPVPVAAAQPGDVAVSRRSIVSVLLEAPSQAANSMLRLWGLFLTKTGAVTVLYLVDTKRNTMSRRTKGPVSRNRPSIDITTDRQTSHASPFGIEDDRDTVSSAKTYSDSGLASIASRLSPTKNTTDRDRQISADKEYSGAEAALGAARSVEKQVFSQSIAKALNGQNEGRGSSDASSQQPEQPNAATPTPAMPGSKETCSGFKALPISVSLGSTQTCSSVSSPQAIPGFPPVAGARSAIVDVSSLLLADQIVNQLLGSIIASGLALYQVYINNNYDGPLKSQERSSRETSILFVLIFLLEGVGCMATVLSMRKSNVKLSQGCITTYKFLLPGALFSVYVTCFYQLCATIASRS